MKVNSTKHRYLFVCATLLGAVCSLVGEVWAQKTAANFYAHLKAEQQAAVKSYIGGKANLRPAQTSDCKNKFGLDSFRRDNGKTAHPYYAVADFNDDQISDFAVVLYDSKKAADARFTVLIFNGAKSGGYKMAFKADDRDLRQGGIWTGGFGSDSGKITLTAGVFETDDGIWVEWADGKYLRHEASESEN